MIDKAPFEVVGYTADGKPTTGADAVVAKGLDGWGLARQAMSPGHSLRIVAPPKGPEPWLRGPDAVVELRTPGDAHWYPVDRRGEWAREGFADPWAALAAVRARPILRDGALAKSRRGRGRRAALRRMGGDDAFVGLRLGRRVVVWPGGDRCFWIDGPGAPTELLDAEQAAAAVDVIIGTTNAASEADRAAWGLDMENRGESNGRAPTVRQREVLSRVGEEFTAAELQESACHRYAGITRRMASEMVARGAIEALGDGRYRKTALAIPSCVREPVKPTKPAQKARKASKKGKSKAAKPGKKPKGPLTAQVGDRMVMPASLNRLDVVEVRSGGRVMVRDRHGELHGPWSPTTQAARIWFRPRTEPAVGGGTRVALDPINEEARAVGPDAPARLAAHWPHASVFLPVLGDDQRRFLIAVAERGVAPLNEVLDRLGWTPAELRRVVPSITSMAQSHDMPLPFVAGSIDGQRVWLWRPEGGDVMPPDPLVEAVRAVPHDKAGIFGVAADGRVLSIGVAKHNARLSGAKKALPLILGAIDKRGPWTVVAVRPGRGRPQHVERVVAERLIAEAPAVGKRIERVVLYTRRPYLLAEAGPEPVAPTKAPVPREPTFVLVGCVKRKAPKAAAARDLYRGALWDLRRRYAEARGLPWGVVSGGLGVVGADERIEPYDRRIQDLSAAQRKAWAKKVQAGLERLAGRGAVVEVIASRPYVEALAEPAKALGITLLAPLAGKGIGDRKKWLAEQITALGGEQAPLSTADARAAVKGWARKGKPPVYTAPSGVVRFGRLGPKGQYRVQRREGGQWRVHGPDHRSFAKASRAAVELVDEGWTDGGGRLPTLAPETAPGGAPSEQIGLTIDVGQPPADVPDDRRLAWMIRQAAERLGRPTRGVWVVCGTEVHPIGALPEGIDVELPALFVDMNPGGEVEAVDADPGFLLAVEPVSRALRRYRLKLDEGQRKRLLDALRLARGEGKRLRDAAGIRRRLTEGFRREQVLAKHEVWTDKARSMSWVTPKGATNDQVIDAFFEEMARRLAEGLPEEIRERAEQVLARAFRMARRRGGPRPRMNRPKPQTKPSTPAKPSPSAKPSTPTRPRPQSAPKLPDRADALRGFGADGQVEWESSVADFCASNAEDPALCARVKALGPGRYIDVGGGAVPPIRIQRRPAKGWPKASSESSAPTTEAYEVIAGHHTRHGYPIWTVRLADRVPRDRFDALKALAKRSADRQSKVRTGYYSSYRKNGATPGFVFGSEVEAQRFVRAAFGGATDGREDDGGRLPTLAAQPKVGVPSTAVADWPEVPFQPGPRTVANLRAVRIAHQARRSGAALTPDQRRHLLQYSGWGGLSIEKVEKDWPDGIPLPNSRALVHEYYTPWTICADIAAVARRLIGSRRGAVRALEPSAGVGRFVHTARFPGWHWTAIELSPLSALILEQTVERPAVVHEGSFESWVEANPDKRFDVIISNPPYGPRGEQMVEDKDRRFRVKAAYQYFILRGLSLLAPGGVAAFLVPGGFLTGNSNGKLRAKIDRDADLLAAFRLPSGTFPGARLSLDVVFFRARSSASSAPDSVFVEGTYFDSHPQHVLGEVKPSGRWGGPEVIGEYRGLPDFAPREQGGEDEGGRMPTLPATDSFADPVRLAEPFASLHALQAASNRAYNYGKALRPGDVPTASKAGWRAAVEDVVRSPRGKGRRLKDLRVALEDLRAAANKASAYEQGGKFTRDGLTRDDARALVFRLRDGRDAIKAGIAAIKEQGRRKAPRVDAKAPRFRSWVQRLGAEHLAGLSALPEWDTLRVADIAGLAELEQARFIRVVAVDGHAAHIRLTDHGKATLAAHPPPKPARRTSPAVAKPTLVVPQDTPSDDLPKGLLGDALLGLDWHTPDEVYLSILDRGVAPGHAARAVATAYAHKFGASPADVQRMAEELRLRNAQPVRARVVDVERLPDPTAVPPGIGVFALRAGEPVVVLAGDPLFRPSTHNFDGMIQALAAIAPGPWVIESRRRPPAGEPRELADVVGTIERAAGRYGVEVADVKAAAATADAKGRHPRNTPISVPEPKLPSLGDRERTTRAKASARAARFADRGGTDTVWHIDGRAIARDSVRMVEIPTGYAGPMTFTDGKDAAADPWADSAMHVTVEMLHRLAERAPEMAATVDGKAFRAAMLNKALSDEPVLRLHAGQLYVESGDPQQKALQVHLGPAGGANLLTKLDRKYLRPALTRISGPLTIRVMGRGTFASAGGVLRKTPIEWGNDVVILDRADGERHIIGPMRLNSVERLNELDSRPIISGPAAEKPATSLAPGFTGLELDDGKPARARKPSPRVPVGLRDVEMERASSALTAALERARFFVDPDDPALRGLRVRGGLLVASDRKRLIEIAVEGAGPDRVVDVDGNALDVDYPEPAELFPQVDPIATVDPAPLGSIANRLAKLTDSPVELMVNGPKLLLAGQPVRGAKMTTGSTNGSWFVSLHRLRPALMGAKSGRILFGATGAPIVIERDDGERHLIVPAEAPCETCPIPEPPPEPPPAPPKGPGEAALAALLDRRLAQYEASDTTRKLLLYPELAAALDAFAEVFGRRIAQVDRPFGIPELALDAHDARLLLAAHPAGVPLDRVANVDKLLRGGWRLDGSRLLPKDDYLSGDLWTRIARLDAIPDDYKRLIEPQRRELEAAIGDISYPEIADRISLRDGWLPLHVIGAYLGSFRRDDKTPIPIERRDGVVQLGGTRFTYDDMAERFANTSSIRMVIGYINHDEQVFRPKKPQKEDINKVRRAKAELFERRFKAFLSTKPDLRDAIVDAYRRTHRGFVPRTYTGAPLQLARWGELITPHPHQNAGARRAVDQRGMVAAYGVGVGKTFTACATVALARQNVGTRRPVILVPNSLVSKWQRDIHKALPDFAVVTIGEKATRGRDGALRYGPDDKADREVKWRRFAAGLYDLALVTPAAFLRTQLTAAEFEALAAGATELQRTVRLAQRTARGRTTPSERQQALLEQGVRAFLAQMMELPKSWTADDIRWSELGVDLLIVDEAQNYKGLHSPETREGSIPRFMGQSSASKRAWNLDARARDVRGRNGFVVLLSATPAKNSPLELYNLWSYVNGELWRDHGIHDPEAFISRFLTIEPRLVIDATMEATERPAVTGFKHLDELKSILLRWGEFIQPPDIGLEVPEPTTELVEVEMDERQEAKYTRYIAQVEAELDAMRRGVKSNKILGLLARMGLVAVHAELDRGLKYKSAVGYDPESPKFTAIADYILANNTCGHIVFVQAIAAHRWLKETLVERGIAADRIGVLNAELAKSSDARQRIADRFNAGRLDVVIANSIAYEGLDLQTRTCAIHHADLPWEPATLNQRNGRAVRQGNTLSTVAIRYYFAQRSMDGLRFNLIQGKQGWMGALLEGSDAIANPGADLELGPDEILLLISRTPEETRKRLDALRAQAEAKRREEEAQRATKLLESGAGQLLEARDARTPDRAENLRAGAEAAFDALERIDPDIWPWRELLRAARESGAVEILGRHGSPPLFPGCWLRWEGDWHHVGRFGWEGTRRTVWLREPGRATWASHKVSAVATNVKPDAVSPTRPTDVTDNWPPDVARVVQRNLGDAWRGWRTLGWNHADPAWLEAAWPPIAADAEQRIAQIRSNAWTGSYGPPESRFPYALDGVVHIHTRGGQPPPGAELLPPTAEGWARWLTLATSDDFKLTVRDEASKWWWGRPLRPGMQRTRQNPSRPRRIGRNRWPAPAGAGAGSTQMHSGDGMQLPAQTPIGTHLVLGIDHGQRLVWLDHARGARQAQAKQKDVPADIPLVAIVQVDNNAVAETRRPMAMAGGPVFVQPALMKTGGGIVIAADGTDAIASVIHARDLDAAYTANRRKVPQGIPRTVIGTIRYLYREAG